MDYNEIKTKIKSSKIIVTGPHFSGTAVCAQALANDLGYTFYSQDVVNGDDDQLATNLIKGDDHFVLQAPGLCHRVHLYQGVAVVVMIRPFHEIVIAEGAAGWTIERKKELQKYDARHRHKIISITKYDFWYRYQRQLLPEVYEMDYYSVPGVK